MSGAFVSLLNFPFCKILLRPVRQILKLIELGRFFFASKILCGKSFSSVTIISRVRISLVVGKELNYLSAILSCRFLHQFSLPCALLSP